MYIQDIKKEFFDVVIGGRVLVLGTVYFFVGLIITDSKRIVCRSGSESSSEASQSKIIFLIGLLKRISKKSIYYLLYFVLLLK
jgi:hypothetical protein